VTGLKVEILHLPEVQAALRAKADRLTPALNDAATVGRRLLVEQLTNYPPPRQGQRYVRTFRLKRGWERATPITGGRGFQLINPVEYAPAVQGTNQRPAFRGRWENVASIAKRMQAEVIAAYVQAVKQAVE